MVVAPPARPPLPENPDPLEYLDALIEEARRRARRRRMRYTACALAAAAGVGAVFGLGGRGTDGGANQRGGDGGRPPVARIQSRASRSVRAAPGNGPLAIISAAGVSTVGPEGSLKALFKCARPTRCYGSVQSIDWSPDGTRLAFSVSSNRVPEYSGIHVLNLSSGTHRLVSRRNGFSLDWSPDGSRIAYVESSLCCMPWGVINVVRADGSGRRIVRTGSEGADASPSWSPDGKRLAFATMAHPLMTAASQKRAQISVIDLDGSHRSRVVAAGSGPAWSPDGKSIAYHARCGGIKLATPTGADVTPSPVGGCRSIGVSRGVPVWSPDGRMLAVANNLGVFVVDARNGGMQPALLTGFGNRETGLGLFGSGRPTWQPIAAAPRSQDTGAPAALVHLYDYDRALLDVKQVSARRTGGAIIRDLSFRSPRGDRVPAYLVVPTGRGPFPAVVIQPGAGQDRRFGLGLARLLARQGLASFLSQPPLARSKGDTPITFRARQDRALWIETVVEVRRSLDLLAARPEIDAKRLGYVGFSMGAFTGGIVSGVDRRITAYVLQAAGSSIKTVIDHGVAGPPPPGARLAAYLRRAVVPFAPARYVGSAAPASLFFQAGKSDDVVGPASLAALYHAASKPKRIVWYSAAHADLPSNPGVTRDAVTWLSARLRRTS